MIVVLNGLQEITFMRSNLFFCIGLAILNLWLQPTHAADKVSTELTVTTGKHALLIRENRELLDGGKIGKWSYDLTSTGVGTPEKLQTRGKIALANNIKTVTLDESGLTSKGIKVDNKITITRGVVNGLLTEILKRESKKGSSNELLGGLPAVIKVTYEGDGNRHSRIWFDGKSNPEQDLPDKEYVTERGKTPLAPTVTSTPVREGTDAGMTPMFSLATGIAFNLADAGGEDSKPEPKAEKTDKEKAPAPAAAPTAK